MSLPEIDLLTSHVSRIFRVEDVTAGDRANGSSRYRGQLLNEDTAAAYDQLADACARTTSRRCSERGGRQAGHFSRPKPSALPELAGLHINIILFILTIFSIMLTGVDIPPEAIPADGSYSLPFCLRYIFTGWPFALSMMGILFAHEMGHYIACRYYKVPATLPYFLPAPLISPLGTFGAFIAMRGIPKNKRVLV